jgi:hypothetical protein
MTRNNADFQASILYHGTSYPFKKGDTVLPAEDTGEESNWDSSVYADLDDDVSEKVYATDKLDVAQHYAEASASNTGRKARVFEVMQLPDDDSFEGHVASDDEREGTEYTSRRGFHVKRQVK